MRKRTLLTTACFLLVLLRDLVAGASHFGFGFGYLVVVEEDASGARMLSVWEPPLRVKDGPWLLRWLDRASESCAGLLENGVAVGDFFPQPIGKEYVALLVVGRARGDDGADGAVRVRLLDPPESFTTRPWRSLGEAELPAPAGSAPLRAADVIGAAAGRFLADPGSDARLEAADRAEGLRRGRADQLVLLVTRDGTSRLCFFGAPLDGPGSAWRPLGERPLDPTIAGARQLATGDFDGDGRDELMLTLDGAATPELAWLELGDELRVRQREPLATGTTRFPTSFVAAADFLKDGFAGLVLGERISAAFGLRTAPGDWRRLNTIWTRPRETFAGARLADQSEERGQEFLRGSREASAGRVVAAGAGRIFGYVLPGCDERKERIWKPWTFAGLDDVEIAFVHRTPTFRLGCPKEWQDGDWPWEPDDHFGWPKEGEEVTLEIHLKNNGKATLPAGSIRLTALGPTPHRNADTLPDAASRISFTAILDQPLPPFDPERPQYAVVPIRFPWPYALVQPDGWTWRRIDVKERGELWFVARIERVAPDGTVAAGAAGDANERNDRWEHALNGLLLHPELRHEPAGAGDGAGTPGYHTLAFRAPTITGDPESVEYRIAKLADAVQCMWERSRTSGGADVRQRVVFDGYRLGWPVQRDLDWSFYEGSRELDQWVGLWGDYERFDPKDGGQELHETGHLFQRVGDLYHYFVFPTELRRIRMEDGTPVPLHTWCWGRDSFCDGQAIHGEATADLHEFLEGVRIGLGWPWHRMWPDKLDVRVLDRDGAPLPGGTLTLWSYPSGAKVASATSTTGLYDLGLPRGTKRFYEPLGLPLHDDPICDDVAHVLTFAAGDTGTGTASYCDFGILGSGDVGSHSRYTRLQKTITDRAGWTWDFPTLFKVGAAPPAFDVTVGVQRREVELAIARSAAAATAPTIPTTYRIWRRWEPTGAFERVLEIAADANGAARWRDDLGAADWFMRGRTRATYYVTELAPSAGGSGPAAESLPRRVQAIGLEQVHGLTATADGRLLATANCGRADPFVVLCRGTTPEEEFLKHFRFGHTAAKVVPSLLTPDRWYATLLASDLSEEWSWPRTFEVIDRNHGDRLERHYAVVRRIVAADVETATNAAPFEITLAPDADATGVPQVGDLMWPADDPEKRAWITRVEGRRLTFDPPLAAPAARVEIEQVAGAAGDDFARRQLAAPRGLATFLLDGREHVAIADTGHRALVIWDRETRALFQEQGFQPKGAHLPELAPVAVALDPLLPPAAARIFARFYVLYRTNERLPGVQDRRGSYLRRLSFNGRRINAGTERAPAEWFVDVGDDPQAREIGLAVALDPKLGQKRIALTDASRRRVVEYRVDSAWLRLEPSVIYTHALPPCVGPLELQGPTDVAWVTEGDELHLYAADGGNRVVRLR